MAYLKETAVVFPGQGSQRPSMGKDFYDEVPVCREVYDEASTALGWDVAALCFSEREELNLTEYAQPCLLTTEIAILRALCSLYEFSPVCYGGHSLGEYTALVASGALPLGEVLKVVHLRGKLMQDAVPLGQGGMSAVISPNLDLFGIQGALADLPMDIANVNSPSQVVISGRAEAMPRAKENIESAMGSENMRFVQLNVSAPFHSRFMSPVEGPFAEALSDARRLLKPEFARSVTSNYTGWFHSGSEAEIVSRLVAQLSNTVQWKLNMEALVSRAATIYEVGPNRPLRGFFKSMGYNCSSVTTFSSARRLFEETKN